jgi:hypothetical protein
MFVDYFRAINKKAVREEQFCSSELWTERTHFTTVTAIAGG